MFKNLFMKKEKTDAQRSPSPSTPLLSPPSAPFSECGPEDATQSLCVTELSTFAGASLCPEQCVQAAGAQAVSYTAQGTRTAQQDAVCIGSSDGVLVGVLCDGMGGLAGGERASLFAANGMMDTLLSAQKRDYSCMSQTVIELNDSVRELRDGQNQPMEAGTTLTVVVIEQGQLCWCSVGDSRIYLWRDGCLQQLSEDHNLKTRLDALVKAGVLSPQDAGQYQQQEALTSYLGIPELVEIGGSRVPVALKQGDVILQCSDGLYRCLPAETICAVLTEEEDLPQAANRLMGSALAKPGAHDNTSLILTRFTG